MIRFEICVAETIETGWSEWFEHAELRPASLDDGGGTLLRGEVSDQAALFGLLRRVRDLNLTLLYVRRLEE
jgi:hypothetical protein